MVKWLLLELGGNVFFIIFDDVDLDCVVEGVIVLKFCNGGQICVCLNWILVQVGVYDVFVEKLLVWVFVMKVGFGIDFGIEIGLMINCVVIDKIDRYIVDVVVKGVIIVVQVVMFVG